MYTETAAIFNSHCEYLAGRDSHGTCKHKTPESDSTMSVFIKETRPAEKFFAPSIDTTMISMVKVFIFPLQSIWKCGIIICCVTPFSADMQNTPLNGLIIKHMHISQSHFNHGINICNGIKDYPISLVKAEYLPINWWSHTYQASQQLQIMWQS